MGSVTCSRAAFLLPDPAIAVPAFWPVVAESVGGESQDRDLATVVSGIRGDLPLDTTLGTAIAKDLELVAGDGICRDAPNLSVVL